jgi:hypothetical protein
MAGEMNRSAWIAALLALSLTVLLWLAAASWQADSQLGSGWTVLLLVVALLSYRLRKALPFLRLGPVSAWRRVHVALGMVLLLMLVLHTGLRWPDTVLERLLLLLLWLASASGLLLTWRAARLPAQLTAAGGNRLLDEIPVARAALCEQARERVLEVAGGPMQQPYQQALAGLLPGGRGWFGTPGATGASSNGAADRPPGFSIAQWRELSELNSRATQLATQQRQQQRWRALLTAHAAFSYALLLFALLHLLQAYRLLAP